MGPICGAGVTSSEMGWDRIFGKCPREYVFTATDTQSVVLTASTAAAAAGIRWEQKCVLYSLGRPDRPSRSTVLLIVCVHPRKGFYLLSTWMQIVG